MTNQGKVNLFCCVLFCSVLFCSEILVNSCPVITKSEVSGRGPPLSCVGVGVYRLVHAAISLCFAGRLVCSTSLLEQPLGESAAEYSVGEPGRRWWIIIFCANSRSSALCARCFRRTREGVA